MTPLTVVLVGAESTGKTTLARALAETLNAPWVREFAREYLDPSVDYDAADVLAIARGQHAAEAQVLADDPPLAIVDTDLLVMHIWSEVRFGQVHPWIIDQLAAVLAGPRARIYLLARPDIPWAPDPLRESRSERNDLHRRYRQALETMAADFIEIGGDHDQRLGAALTWINERHGDSPSDVTR